MKTSDIAKHTQRKMFGAEKDAASHQPVECLGIKFPNDEARRAYFLEKLREKLKDPAFRKIEGFTIGADEDIIALSNPPYYTACPNPFIEQFLTSDSKDKREKGYHRSPFAADVSEGKDDPIYKAHSYHTKVPHKVVMRYILHYTDPGDVVLDAFCGTGMTGVASQLCGDRKEVASLGYQLAKNGDIADESGRVFSRLGVRPAVLSDLSPTASFVASNYSSLSDLSAFQQEALACIDQIETGLSWLFESKRGRFVSAIWSDVVRCPTCSKELVFWEVALREGALEESFPCPHCSSIVGKAASKSTGAVNLERSFEQKYDPFLHMSVKVPKWVVVQQTFEAADGHKSLHKEQIDSSRLIVESFSGKELPNVPTDEFFPGRQTNKLIHGSGIQHVAHMYSPRALVAYATLWRQELSSARRTSLFRFCLTAINNFISRKQGYFGGGGGVSGTLFTPSVHIERNVFDVLRRKIKAIGKLSCDFRTPAVVSTQSVADLSNIPANSIDYIFTDPPFGESLQYAELNMFTEAWLGVKTKAQDDCVLDCVHEKQLDFFSAMMHRAFAEYARVLKPGRWMTVEFHNSQNTVWNVIQQAMESAGLTVADVRILDKQQKGFNAVNRAGAVDKDLVISAYKPDQEFVRSFGLKAGSEEGAWSFVENHLAQLPIFVAEGGKAEIIIERQGQLLFDRMIAFHVQRNVSVSLTATEFYAGLRQRFPERDGMFFLPQQISEYDLKRLEVRELEQLELFVSDEKSAIQWVRNLLSKQPMKYQDLSPLYMKEAQRVWEKHEQPLELRTILEQNFVEDDDGAWRIADPRKESDLEQLRNRALIKEFQQYLGNKGKLKVVRMEALRAGFKECWQKKDYTTILQMTKRVPEAVIQEDPALLMYFDNASLLIGE